MSNIPSNAMPHAGGPSANDDAHRGATQTTGQTTGQATGAQAGSQSSGYAADTNVRSQQSDTRFAQSASYSRQPESHNEGSYQRQSGGSVLDKAREHKTGLAVGLAVGAIAATAIPLMFGKKKNRDRQEVDHSAVYVESRGGQDFGRAGSATPTAQVTGTADTPVVSATGRNQGKAKA